MADINDSILEDKELTTDQKKALSIMRYIKDFVRYIIAPTRASTFKINEDQFAPEANLKYAALLAYWNMIQHFRLNANLGDFSEEEISIINSSQNTDLTKEASIINNLYAELSNCRNPALWVEQAQEVIGKYFNGYSFCGVESFGDNQELQDFHQDYINSLSSSDAGFASSSSDFADGGMSIFMDGGGDTGGGAGDPGNSGGNSDW